MTDPIKTELDELNARIKALSAFLTGNDFRELAPRKRYLARGQLSAMCGYRDILEKRLELEQ